MLKVVTAAQMRRIDAVAIRERGIPGLELMERAGEAVAREVVERFEPQSVAVVTGKGNNGGDGFVAARLLHQRNVKTTVFALFGADQLSGDALDNSKKLPGDLPVEIISTADSLREPLRGFDVIVDAILGTGLKGPVTGFLADAIEAVNSTRIPVVAVDIPSGLLADSQSVAAPLGPHIRAALTVSMGLPKIGMVLDPGMRSAGVVTVADIGFPDDLLRDPAISASVMEIQDAKAMLPPRPPWGNKGTFGGALILGGSEGMTGAAILAAQAASRSGVGLVYSSYPRPLGEIFESHLIEPVKRPLPGGERWFTATHVKTALRESENVQSVALGPGIGQRPTTAKFVSAMIRGIQAPMVLDADAINLLTSDVNALKCRAGPTILTPHPGELARLLKSSVAEIESNRLDACISLSREFKVVVALKGSQTIITTPDGQRFINPSGNSGLAKGGSGDVLTGLLAGLLAQGCPIADASRLGVFLHGLAADRAAAKLGVRAMTPSDVIANLGNAFLSLRNEAN